MVIHGFPSTNIKKIIIIFPHFFSAIGCREGAIRLVGGSSRFEGVVEICRGGLWGSFSSINWNLKNAEVVCRQLGLLSTSTCKNVHMGSFF